MSFACKFDGRLKVVIKPVLDIRSGQRQRLAPYLPRLVQVMQASSQALQKEIASVLASNPFLEEDGSVARPSDVAKSSSIKTFRDRAHSNEDRFYPSLGSPSVSTTSTVSRASAGKYILTPNDTREFRFFSRQIDV
jgi:DNA-directed RNA polymerase specialized sigma54-like protein